jgi:ribose transport system permease protein
MSDAISRLGSKRIAFAVVFAVALFIANAIESSGFLSTSNLEVNAGTLAPFVLAAMASTPAFLSGGGGIDLSVTPLMALSNIVLVTGMLGTGLGSPLIAIPLLLLMGAVVGAGNGLLIAKLRFPPVIATLGTFFMLSGLDLGLLPTPITAKPGWIDSLAGDVGPVPGAVFTILVPLACWWLLRRTPLVSMILSVGDNAASSFSAGVSVDAVKIAAYTIGGLLAALGGIALSGLIRSADTTSYTGYTVAALAAVALGGTNLAGGAGGLAASAIGALCIYLLDNLLASLQVSSDYTQVAYGAVLLVAVVVGSTVINRTRAALA